MAKKDYCVFLCANYFQLKTIFQRGHMNISKKYALLFTFITLPLIISAKNNFKPEVEELKKGQPAYKESSPWERMAYYWARAELEYFANKMAYYSKKKMELKEEFERKKEEIGKEEEILLLEGLKELVEQMYAQNLKKYRKSETEQMKSSKD